MLENFFTKSTKIPVLLAMAQGSTRFEHLEKSIDDYIIEQQNKNTKAKTTRDVKLLIEFVREKKGQRNPEDIEAEELNENRPYAEMAAFILFFCSYLN